MRRDFFLITVGVYLLERKDDIQLKKSIAVLKTTFLLLPQMLLAVFLISLKFTVTCSNKAIVRINWFLSSPWFIIEKAINFIIEKAISSYSLKKDCFKKVSQKIDFIEWHKQMSAHVLNINSITQTGER